MNPWDWIGVFQSFFGMAALVQDIEMLAKYGIMNLAFGGMLLIGIVLLIIVTLRYANLKVMIR